MCFQLTPSLKGAWLSTFPFSLLRPMLPEVPSRVLVDILGCPVTRLKKGALFA